ncbi:hypothetical protein ACS0TY_036991 [Phlomoides rotata]
MSSSDPILSHQNPENGFVNGMVDYSGRPSLRSHSGFWRSASYIIGGAAAERFAYWGVSSNLITYLTGPLHQSTAGAAASINIWGGSGLMLPLLGAFVESYLGRFRTVVFSSLLYVLALGLLTTSVFLDCKGSPTQLDILFFFVSLYLIALGQGVYRACILAFGADQFDDEDPHELRCRSSFFNWWSFGMCVVAPVALPALNYVQDNISWGIGFGIPCISMVIALLVFIFGFKSYRYRVKVDEKCVVSRVSLVFVKALMNWRAVPCPSANNDDEEQHNVPRLYSQQYKFLNKALLAPDGSFEYEQLHKMQEVEEAKAILNLVPLWVTSLAFAITYAQPGTFFTKQGITMDRSITPTLDIPSASLQYTIGITAILFIPLYDRVFVPLARILTATSSGITELQRIGTGMLLITLTMVTAALVEQKRLKTALEYGLVDTPDARVPLSFWWLLPQYIMFGMSEVLTLIGLQELFYDQMPCGLKAVGLSVYLSILGMGQFMSSFLICIIQKVTSEGGEDGWFSDNTNRARLDCFYWLLALLNAIGFLAFFYFARNFSSNTSIRGTVVC